VSLKAFHILFIALSVVLAIGFGVWEIVGYMETTITSQLVMGLLSFIVAVALILYGIRFLRKLKHVGYL
jgi:hypothetical protein